MGLDKTKLLLYTVRSLLGGIIYPRRRNLQQFFKTRSQIKEITMSKIRAIPHNTWAQQTMMGILLVIGAVTFLVPAMAQSLSTRRGFELGVQVSQYGYEETSLDVENAGNKVGLTAAYTFTANRWFGKADVKYAYGKLRYSSPSGVSTGVPDSNFEARLVGGRDFFPGTNLSVSPYIGIGHRQLFNDARGESTNGAVGYRRYSQYLYVPIGITASVRAGNGWTIVPNVEYDYFVRGKQVSRLTDTGFPGIPDIKNNQGEGYGIRGSLMFEKGNWSFGPWMHGWMIKKSNTVGVPVGDFMVGFQEPENKQWEMGMQAIYRF